MVWQLEVVQGQSVATGDVIAIIESMKMEIPIEAPVSGTVTALQVAQGDSVTEGDVVVILD